MKKIFITGDRSMEHVFAAGLINAVIKDLIQQNNGDLAIATGNLSNGVERAVRYIAPEASLNVFEYRRTPTGHVDFAEMYSAVNEEADEVIFIHDSPQSSRIGKALFDAIPSEKITMPLQEAELNLL